jgi:hypothetical protein
MSSDTIERRLQELRELAKKYAQAEAQRTHIEEFKKSKLAILMKQAERDGDGQGQSHQRQGSRQALQDQIGDRHVVAGREAEAALG